MKKWKINWSPVGTNVYSTSQFFLPHPLSKMREKLNCSYGSRQLNVRQIQSEWRISTTWLNMCNPEIWINLNLPKLYNNYLKPVPRLWDLGIGNFTPSAFPGFEWVRTKSKKIYWRNLRSRSEAAPCTKGKSTQKLHVRPKQSTNEIWLKALKTFQYPPQPVSFSLGLSSGAFSARCRDWDSKFMLSECLPYLISCCSWSKKIFIPNFYF